MNKSSLLLLVISLILISKSQAQEISYKEYSLGAGESIAALISKSKSVDQQLKTYFINDALRVNKYTSDQARKLPIGTKVLIPQQIYHEVNKNQSDSISTINSSVLKTQTQVSNTNNREIPPYFLGISYENTNLHTDKVDSSGRYAADKQALKLSLATQLKKGLYLGGTLFKDVSASDDEFIANDLSYTFGFMTDLYSRNFFNFSAGLFYENQNYNFTGLKIGRFENINQKSALLKLEGHYSFNDYYALGSAFEYGLNTNVENNAFNALELESNQLTRFEVSFQYSIETDKTVFIALANERLKWSGEGKSINYNSDLLKLGFLLKI